MPCEDVLRTSAVLSAGPFYKWEARVPRGPCWGRGRLLGAGGRWANRAPAGFQAEDGLCWQLRDGFEFH